MKKLFLFSVAALAFCACSNDTVVSDSNSVIQPKEMSFAPLTKPNTRGQYSVTTASFPSDNTMQVRAYQTQPSAGEYFAQTFFEKGTTHWGGNPARYWPLSAAKLNFFAVSGFGLNNAHITINNELASANVAYTTDNSYSATTQSDIMYAFGRGEVTKSDNTLTFNGGNPVNMVFKHALALVDFQVKGSGTTETGAITVNSITLKGAKYNGTLTLTNTNAATESGDVTTAVSWEPGDAVESVAVPGITPSTAITDSYAPIGNGLMIIPGTGFTSFVINYTMNNLTYNFEYTPSPAVSTTTAATKYTYRINFTLNEILINPSVTEWTAGSATDINIP